MMDKVVIPVMLESPYAGDVALNKRYARECMLESLTGYGEAPMLGHLLYTQVLDDAFPEERRIGIDAHLTWLRLCSRVAVYIDLGMSSGMEEAIKLATLLGIPIHYRKLSGWKP